MLDLTIINAERTANFKLVHRISQHVETIERQVSSDSETVLGRYLFSYLSPYFVIRDTVMRLQTLDPGGVMERKNGRLRRRVYLSKVT